MATSFIPLKPESAERTDPRAGRVVVRILLLMLLIGALVGSLLFVMTQIQNSIICTDNLKTIYQALELYEMERGVLPTLAYFPDHATDDGDSLRVVLEPYGLNATQCICPNTHPLQKAEGLTYLWNVELNGQRLPRKEPVWMLVDMSALSDEVPSSHLGRYNALFSDGSIKRISDPYSALPGL